ncbi:MAG: malto-oligosyltrehalose synthase [Desulfomonilaceae bacterium]
MITPTATYRIQFTPFFGFQALRKIVPYLAELGISDIYASPVFKARSGSLHGYDVVDPTQLNPELGAEEDFAVLAEEVKRNDLGWIQDVVPNHMAYTFENKLLMDLLENGQGSKYFPFFDIDWEHHYENLKGQILAPFLGRFYGESLEDAEIILDYGPQGLTVRYYDVAFPVRVQSYPNVFSRGLASLRNRLGEDHPDFIKLLGVLYILKTFASQEAVGDRYVEIRFIKRMLWEAYSRNNDIKEMVDENIQAINGSPGKPESFNLLDDLLSGQLFKLSYWKVATKEINYRRFFNINELISLRVQDEAVFDHTHKYVLQLIQEGTVSGLRIDHVDGLYDPGRYLKRLRAKAPETFMVVEKILGPEEDLCNDWPVQGTTGYDFMNYVNGLFCERKNQRTLDRIWFTLTGSTRRFADLLREKKRLIIVEHMAGDVNNLAQLVKTISSRDRHGSDITMFGLRRAILEVLAAFPVYRTYINDRVVSESDRSYIEQAVDRATAANPALIHEFKFIRRFLLLNFPEYMDEQEKSEWLKFAMRFQQYTGPLMAKGLEDTALYVYNKLISLNEVGGRPDRFGCLVKEFHSFNRKRQTQWPYSFNATSTHDTKRGEDVRARINVLSEIPREWERNVRNWSRINKGRKIRVRDMYVPDKNDEYFLYQTLLGAFPFRDAELPEFVERIKEYIIKAVREAKVHTEWIKPDVAYESAYLAFLEKILDPSEENAFLREFLPFQREIAHYGVLNSLSQALIKITSPGIPDFYQGTELWDLNLVDPDNRRPINFEHRIALLENIRRRAETDLLKLIEELLADVQDGRIKLFLVQSALRARKSASLVFRKGGYVPLRTAGKFEHNVIAFARRHNETWAVTIAPRFLCSMVEEGSFPLGTQVWQDTRVILPGRSPSIFRNVFTNEMVSGGDSVGVGEALRIFPEGLLMAVFEDPVD